MDLTVPQRLYRLEQAQEEYSEALTRLEKDFRTLTDGVEELLSRIVALEEAPPHRAQPESEPEPKREGPPPGMLGTWNQSGGRQSLQ